MFRMTFLSSSNSIWVQILFSFQRAGLGISVGQCFWARVNVVHYMFAAAYFSWQKWGWTGNDDGPLAHCKHATGEPVAKNSRVSPEMENNVFASFSFSAAAAAAPAPHPRRLATNPRPAGTKIIKVLHHCPSILQCTHCFQPCPRP